MCSWILRGSVSGKRYQGHKKTKKINPAQRRRETGPGKYFPFTTFRRLNDHTRLTLFFLSLKETWLARNFYPTPERQKPVPTKGERQALAKETGLTERQVCDWFVNARARVWKPEMQALLLEMETE
tara:strand:+ start:131 stop:508 length:378 start_codon:yes stop_codon:yes gene_type:complete